MTSLVIDAVSSPTAPSVYFLTDENLYKASVKFSAGLFRRGHAAKLCYSVFEHALARQIKHDKTVSDFAEKMSRRSPNIYSYRLLCVVRAAGALLIASS